jgi:hypothetical protein
MGLVDTLLGKVRLGELAPPMTARTSVIGVASRLRAGWVVAAVASLGMIGNPGRHTPPLLDAHALFGAVLVSGVILGFWARMSLLPYPTPGDIRSVSRPLSRQVYLVLALQVAFRQLAMPEIAPLRDYLVYGLIALAAIRIMAIAYWLRSRRR